MDENKKHKLNDIFSVIDLKFWYLSISETQQYERPMGGIHESSSLSRQNLFQVFQFFHKSHKVYIIKGEGVVKLTNNI